MKNVKVYSVNCEACNSEFLNYQIRTAKVGSRLMELCPICHTSTDAYKQFCQAAIILNKLYRFGELDNDPQTNSPNIVIEPIDSNIQSAVELLKRMDSNFFVGIKKIVAGSEANYGHTSSDDPTIVYINLNKIVNEAQKDNSKRSIIISLAATIAHEVGHAKSYNLENGFVGGESPAMNSENKIINWIKANENRLQDLFK